MQFEFSTSQRILFGPGVSKQIGTLAGELGSRVLLVGGSRPDRLAPVQADLEAAGLDLITFQVEYEPTTHLVQNGVALARESQRNLVVGCGGGSVLDAAKAIAVLLTNPGEPLDYLEVVGRGQKFTHPPVPCIAMPTTAGTGTEVTRNAVLESPEHRVKASLRSPLMIPRLALIDPELTYSLPPAVTASTGLDALTQVLEPYVSKRANPLTDSLCREGLSRAGRSLRRAYEHGEDAQARQDMVVTSLFGGLALANAGLGAVHGFAAPLGGRLHAPHGAVCAILLPHVIEANIHALQEREPQNPVLPRYDEIARLLTGQPGASAENGIAWLQELVADLRVPSLSSYGVKPGDIPGLVENTIAASSYKANPIELTRDELAEVLSKAL